MSTEQEIVETPQRPGYYWAKWKIPSPGTFEGDENTPSQFWEIVTVWENCTYPTSDERFGVSIPGVREAQWPDQFYWGPMVAEYNPASVDEYVAWCRYTRRGEIVTCDSDAPKAFRVYRHPSAIRSLPQPSEPSGEERKMGETRTTKDYAEVIRAKMEADPDFNDAIDREMEIANLEVEACDLRTALRELAEALKNLTAASRPFVDRGTVDETAGTVPLMNTLEAAIELAQQALATLKGRSKFVSESKQANGITAKSTIWPDDETMEIFRSLAARIALKDAHIAGLNEEIKIQAARIAELEAQNAEREADVRCPGCGRSMQFCDCDPNLYRKPTPPAKENP